MKFWEAVRQEVRANEYWDGYEPAKPAGRLSRLLWWPRETVREAYGRWVAPAICAVRGCDVEVDEDGSGESGRVDWACKRCGKGGRGWF